MFYFLSYNSSWLLFPCESTFILKLLPRAEVLWKIRLQFFQSSVAVSECLCVCRGKTTNAAFERSLRTGLLGCHDIVSGDQ